MTFIVIMLAIVLVAFCLTGFVLTSICRVWLERINEKYEKDLKLNEDNIRLMQEIVRIRDEINFEYELKGEKNE